MTNNRRNLDPVLSLSQILMLVDLYIHNKRL